MRVILVDPERPVTLNGTELPGPSEDSHEPLPLITGIKFNLALSIALRIVLETSFPLHTARPTYPSLFPTTHNTLNLTRRPESVIL